MEDITDDIFKFTTNFAEEMLEAGEAWVNENVPGVKALTTGFESIDIVLDYVDKGVAIVELAKKTWHYNGSGYGFWRQSK